MRGGVVERFWSYIFESCIGIVVSEDVFLFRKARYPLISGTEQNFRNAIMCHIFDFEVILHVETQVEVVRLLHPFSSKFINKSRISQNEDLDITHGFAESVGAGWLYRSQQ